MTPPPASPPSPHFHRPPTAPLPPSVAPPPPAPPAHCRCLGLKPPKKRLDYNPDISARQRIEVKTLHSPVFFSTAVGLTVSNQFLFLMFYY